MQISLELRDQHTMLPGPWEEGVSRIPMPGHGPPALASCRSCQELLVTASNQKNRLAVRQKADVPSKQYYCTSLEEDRDSDTIMDSSPYIDPQALPKGS